MIIKRASNGLIIDSNSEIEGGSEIVIFQDPEDDSVEWFVNVLSHIMDRLGPGMGRHSKERIYIEVRPGDKYET